MTYRYQVEFYSGVPHIARFNPRFASDFDLEGNIIGGMPFDEAKQIVTEWYAKEYERIAGLEEVDVIRQEAEG